MRKIKRIFTLIVLLLIIAIIIFQIAISKSNDNVFGLKEFTIAKGDGVTTISKNLVEGGFLSSPLTFKMYVLLSGNRSNFKEGTFSLATNLDIKELTAQLVSQNNDQSEATIKIIEGWDVMEIDAYLAQNELIKAGELIDYSDNLSNTEAIANGWNFLLDRPKKSSLEGYLYPDTYRVFRTATVADIAGKMLDNFKSKVTDEMLTEIKSQKKTLAEVVNLASIVEKEMYGYENRRKVADIFITRIDIGMALQSDATVNYITAKGTTRPSLDDLQIDNLYNTYKYRGLPPGPICNPSIEAIKAVIYPEKTPYLYFLTTKDDKIIFSRTYDEHLANKRKYLD